MLERGIADGKIRALVRGQIFTKGGIEAAHYPADVRLSRTTAQNQTFKNRR